MLDKTGKRQGATRRGKPHCEAFPALDIRHAIRGLKVGADRCVWQNEQGQIIGHGHLTNLTAASATVSYQFFGSANLHNAEGSLTVEVRQTRRNPHVLRSSFACPTCDKNAEKLFFVKEKWLCRACHGLVFFSQRLGEANKKISGRDYLVISIKEQLASDGCKGSYHNRVRHLDRINRELEMNGLSALPQELLYRTDQIWLTSAEMRARLGAAGSAITSGTIDETGFADGLAFFKPAVPASAPTVRGELVGSTLFARPCERYLTRHRHDEAARLLSDIVEGRLGHKAIGMDEFVALLVARTKIEPILLSGEWGPVQHRPSGGGAEEYAMSAAIQGDARLWQLCADEKPHKHVLKAVLDDRSIELRVRLNGAGPFDPRADLKNAAQRLTRQLARLNDKIAAHNLQRHRKAQGWASLYLASRSRKLLDNRARERRRAQH